MDTAATIPDPVLALFSGFVEKRLGLSFPKERWGDLERGVLVMARESGCENAQACILKLMAPPLDEEQMEMLAANLTIGETYFFRDKRIFEVLEQDILPALIQDRRGRDRRLRIWSAGCCTGGRALLGGDASEPDAAGHRGVEHHDPGHGHQRALPPEGLRGSVTGNGPFAKRCPPTR